MSKEKSVEQILGYSFRDKKLLDRCFTHSSYTNEHKEEENNERLEFLGDAVLELVFSEKLYFEGTDEGTMTNNRQKLVSDDALEVAVKKLGLHRYLRFGGGKSNVGKKAIPSLFEAVVAGIYLDGGYAHAKSFILANISQVSDNANYVGMLQEFTQQTSNALPEYRLVEKTGEDNSPLFTVSVSACGMQATGKGESKKSARMLAAKQLYFLLKKS